MKKMILILTLSFVFLGCEESGPAAKTIASAPSSEIESPIVDEPTQEQDPVVVNPKTVYFELTTSEPTQYQIKIYKLIPNVGYEQDASLIFQGTTSANKTTHNFVADYPCKILIFKQQVSSPSQMLIKQIGFPDYNLQMSNDYWIHETYFN